MGRRGPMLTLAAALLVSACAAPPDTTWVRSSDPALARMAGELLPALAAKANLALTEPVRVEWRSREELERYLRVKVDEELPVARAQALSDAYGLLGLFPAPVDLRALLLDVHLEQVAGFYDPDSTALFVMREQPEAMTRTILVHELVHAIQDQTTSLDSITARERGTDRQTAAQAAIEGHATLVMLEFMAEGMRGEPLDLSTVTDFQGRIRPLLEQARTQYPALASAPRVIQESLLYPYLAGAGFVQALWQAQGGRPAPFGRDLPQSTEQVDDPARFVGERDDPTALALTAPGVEIRIEDELGQLGTRILLEERAGTMAGAAARGWDGDRFLLWEQGGQSGLVWATVWDDPAARDAFLDTLAGGEWALEARTVSDRPVAIVRIGAEPPSGVELSVP
ncbi:MAG: DUF6782 family putative metallopeptidase [Gemmatimonadota bacterium]|nr:hypothetical protein [Gemmatimonadota bacterium]